MDAGPWVAIAIACRIFPKTAFGMSGFETGVLHIQLVRGTLADPAHSTARIRHTRMLLITAAVLMSILLLGSSLITRTDTFSIVARGVASVSHTIAQIAIEMSKSGSPLDIVFVNAG